MAIRRPVLVSSLRPVLALLTLSAALGGCGETFEAPIGAGASDGFGATPGGVKDMSYAREIVANGKVPPAETLLVEGMFSEHDLGIAGPPCDRALCLRAAGGVAPDEAGATRGWVQIGMSSNIDPATWAPPATTYVFTVDVSGSMEWARAADDYPSPGRLARALLHGLADRLRPEDRVAIVTYGSTVEVPLAITAGTERAKVHAAIAALRENGSTDMEAGLRRAYQLARPPASGGQARIVLFTDVQPNVGATQASEFEGMVAEGAEAGVSITVLGLGLGVGPSVLQGMAHLRGANAFTMTRLADTRDFLDQDYPFFTTPIAHDLSVDLTGGAGLELLDGYGFPAGPSGGGGFEVSSVFLSQRRGAVLVSLAGDGVALDALSANIALRYTSLAGMPYQQAIEVRRTGGTTDERGHWFGDPATARTTALAVLVAALHAAAERYGDAPAEAEVIARRARDRIVADAAAFPDDAGMAREAKLALDMLTLIEARAPQGTFYGE